MDTSDDDTLRWDTFTDIQTPADSDLEAPANATTVGPWTAGLRVFDGPEWAVTHATHAGHYNDDITVAIIGTQHTDGRIERKIVLGWPIDPVITADEARKLMAALSAAVDAADEG
jgi:hypothetical protein